jgi:hypothetical protein
VKPRSRTRLIPPSSRTVGHNPRIENVADPRDAPITAEQTSYRSYAPLDVRFHLFYQCDLLDEAASIEPTRRSLPTIGFDLRRLGVWQREIARSLCWIESKPPIQLDANRWLALQQSVRIVEARSPQSVVETMAKHGSGRLHISDGRVLYRDAGTSLGILVAAQAGRYSAFSPHGESFDLLDDAVASYDVPLRVRLLFWREGGVRVEHSPLQRYRGAITEAIVTIEEFRSASRIWLINSVHEWRPAVMS